MDNAISRPQSNCWLGETVSNKDCWACARPPSRSAAWRAQFSGHRNNGAVALTCVKVNQQRRGKAEVSVPCMKSALGNYMRQPDR